MLRFRSVPYALTDAGGRRTLVRDFERKIDIGDDWMAETSRSDAA